MNRETIKKLLTKHYSISGADMILRGARKPSYEIMCELDADNNIPFSVWRDIKSFISKDNYSGKESFKSTTSSCDGVA